MTNQHNETDIQVPMSPDIEIDLYEKDARIEHLLIAILRVQVTHRRSDPLQLHLAALDNVLRARLSLSVG